MLNAVDCVYGIIFRGHFEPPGKFVADTFDVFTVEHDVKGQVNGIPKGRDVEGNVLGLVIVPDEFEGLVQLVFLFLCVIVVWCIVVLLLVPRPAPSCAKMADFDATMPRTWTGMRTADA